MNLQWIEDYLSDDNSVLEFIINHKLIDNIQKCDNHHDISEMSIIYDDHIKIKHIWRCPICKKKTDHCFQDPFFKIRNYQSKC